MVEVTKIKMSGLTNINIGYIVNGIVIKKKPREVFVEIPNFGVARIYGREYIKGRDLIAKLKEGDNVVVKILGFDDGYGNFEAEIQDIEHISTWAKLREYMAKKTILELPIKDINKGGLIVEVENVKGFVPVSQLAPENYPRVDNKTKILQQLEKFKGKKMKLRIINVDPASQKLILSERAAKEEEYKEILSKFSVGQVVEVRILGFSSFGIFVRFYENPSIDGLIHISEIPEEYKNFEEHFKVGDKIKAKIIKIETDRVNLTLKDLVEDPWIAFCKKYNIGSEIEGLVVDKSSEFFAVVECEGVKGIVLEDLQNLELNNRYKFEIIQLVPNEKKLVLKLKNEK
ncbi:MAG: S1 RNA-binding domain-containing protein [Minisyncoccia bacterium]